MLSTVVDHHTTFSFDKSQLSPQVYCITYVCFTMGKYKQVQGHHKKVMTSNVSVNQIYPENKKHFPFDVCRLLSLDH